MRTKRHKNLATDPTRGRCARFVREYIKDRDGGRAYLRAGYNCTLQSAQSSASFLLADPKVQAEIRRLEDMRLKASELEAKDILAELIKLAFASLDTAIVIGEDGTPNVNLADLKADEMAAISEITTDEYVVGKGPGAREVRKTRIKLCDKLKALEQLVKIAGLEAPRKVELGGPDGAPLQFQRVVIDPDAPSGS